MDRCRKFGGQPRCVIGDMSDQRAPPGSGLFCERWGITVQMNQMIQRRTCRRLAPFIQPKPRQHRIEVRPPDARNGGRLLGRGHGAGRGAKDIGQPPGWRGILTGDLHPKRAEPTGMGIDQRRGNRDASAKPKISGGDRGQFPQRGAGGHHLGADAAELLFCQHTKADGTEIIGIPPTFMRQVGPFAGDGAGRPRKPPRRPPGQVIGQVEEMLGRGESFRPVTCQP